MASEYIGHAGKDEGSAVRGDHNVSFAGELFDDVDDEALETVVAQLRCDCESADASAPKSLPKLSSTRWRSDFRR